MIKRLQFKLINKWQLIAAYLVGSTSIFSLLLYRLGTLTPGLSSVESASLTDTRSIADIGNNPVNAPFKLMEWLFHHFDQTSLFALRSVSVFFGIITVGLFFYFIKSWHTPRIAVIGTVMLTSSAWFLHVARQASPDILLVFAVAAVLAYGTWLKNTNKSSLAVLLGSFLFATAIYIPGVIWILAAGVIWKRKLFIIKFRHANLLVKIVSGGMCLLSIAALCWASLRHPHIIYSIIGLPVDGKFYFKDTLLNFVKIPVRVFYQGPNDPAFWLGRLPLLGIFASVVSAVGVYAYWFKLRLDRTKALLYLLIFSAVLSSFSGQTSLSIILPLMYVLATGGITLLLQQWLTVFPRNPLARSIGRGLVTVAVLFAAFYQINQYFVAWPNSPSTKAAFTYRRQ